jgi:hypothetical protein
MQNARREAPGGRFSFARGWTSRIAIAGWISLGAVGTTAARIQPSISQDVNL